MDIAKIKNSLPAIDLRVLQNACQRMKFDVKIFKTIDQRSLLIGLAGVACIFGIVILYISIYSSSTIQHIESQLASETMSVKYVKKSKYGHDLSDGSTISDGLYESTPLGNMPIIRISDNLTSFRAYQHPYSFENIKKPILSFVVVDYGLSKKQSESALDLLPSEVSFILSPYSDLPNEWIKMAQDKGHEVWMNLPIQNEKSFDTGKNTVFHHATLAQKQRNMHSSLALAQGYIGVGSYTDDSAQASNAHYFKLTDELYSRGLGFFELNPNAPETLERKALTAGTPYIKADLEVFRIKGKNSFQALENIAHTKGHAIAVIPNHPEQIKNLAVWIMKVAQADYAIAPVSAIYDLPLYRSSGTALHPNDHIEPIEQQH